MTTLNAIAAAATVELPASAPAEHGAGGGAAFAAVLDNVMRVVQHAAAKPAVVHAAKPAQAVEAPTRAFHVAPVEQTESEEAPTVAEIALPIEALTSYLAAFIALFAQAMAPTQAAEATAEVVEGDDLTVAALGVSVERSTQDADSSLTELFAALVESADDELALRIADRAAEGASLREMVAELTEALSGAEEEAPAEVPAPAQSSAPAVQSIGQLVETLAQLAATVRDAAGEGSAQVTAAVAAVTTARNDDVSFERLAGGTPIALGPRAETAPLTQVADLVATLTREIASARPVVEAEARGAENAQLVPQLRETTAQVLVALAESAQGLRAAQVSGSAQVTIQLKPESLGKVTIELERTSEGVVARVAAATPEAQRAIAENTAAVQDALAEVGVAVTKIEVGGPSTAAQANGFQAVLDEVVPVAVEQSAHPVDARPRPAVEQPAPSQPVAADEAVVVVDEPTDSAEPVDAGAAQPVASQPSVSRAETSAMTSEAAPLRGGVTNLVRDIADQAGVLLNQGKSEFQIQLRPDTLGRLNVKMTLEGGEVTVQMRAESAQAKSAIEASLGQLRQSFQEQGIRVDRFEVVVAQGQLAQEHGHPRRSRGWVDDVRRRPSSRDDGEFAGALAAAVRPVDYRA